MVEYGVNVANKFGFLSDDEFEDPDVILRRAEAASKKEEKSASQKKADRHAAAKKKKDAAVAAAINAAARETEAKKTTTTGSIRSEANKENRPEVERGRGRGRGRGFYRGRGAGGVTAESGNVPDQPVDIIGERFGEIRGRGRGRGFRGGRPPFRGGRGGFVRPQLGQGGNEFHDEIPEDVNVDSEQHVTEVQNFVPRGGFRGGRGRGVEFDRPFRGGRGGRGRVFDRFSGSDKVGVKSVEKKDGYGKGNWGTEQDELEATTEPAEVTVEGEKIEEPPREKTEEELRAEAEAEELAKQKTLDEFKAEMEKREKPQFNIRRAGEGTNEKEFGKLVPLAKEEIEEPPEEEIMIVRREPRSKRLDIEINFTDEVRGGRGGRGRMDREGYRGRGNRGNRDSRSQKMMHQDFDISSDAFPALGAQ